MPLLKRKYRLVVGKPPITTITTEYITEDEVFGQLFIPKENDYRTVTLNAVEITELDINATISSKAGGKNSSSVIKIYNLSEDTRNIVERVNNYVILEAGYASDEELKVVFTGQVSEFFTENVGEDLVTTLQCKDGYIPNNTLRVDKFFPAGVTADTIFKYIIDQYKKVGVPLGFYSGFSDKKERVEYVQLPMPQDTTFYMGYTLTGYLWDELKDLTKSLGYVCYITNGRLFIHPKGFTRAVEQFEVDHSQIYSIKKSGKANNNTTGKSDTGVNISLPLDARMDVDKQIKVIGGDFEGVYKIMERSFNISIFDGNFDTNLVCKSVEA